MAGDGPSSAEAERKKITGRAGIVAAGTLFSRILGLVRDQVLAAVFSRAATDAFFVAFTIPNVLRQLLAEGAVQNAVLPVLAKTREQEGDEAARRLFRAMRGLSLLILTVVTIAGVVLAPQLVDLFAALGPDADSTGAWTDGANNPMPNGSFNPSQFTVGTYSFTYTVTGAAPCTNATATITVNVGAGLNAGVGGTDTICGGLTAYDLFGSLGGSPDPGGVWSEQLGSGAISGNFLDATLLTPGSSYPMVYTLNDLACGEVQSVVHLFIFPYPDPGPDTSVTLCATDDILALASLIF